jgi:hypothetical protein
VGFVTFIFNGVTAQRVRPLLFLGSVVQPSTGFDEDMLDVGELGDLGLCGWMAPSWIFFLHP